MSDQLKKFLFENAAIRGELIELETTWQLAREHFQYPRAVEVLLGEMMAAAGLLSANLKFDGSLIMQIHGDGPIKLLVVECDSNLNMRATAKLRDDKPIADTTNLHALVHENGQGRFVITLDPRDKLPGQQAYQGVVPLDGNSIATVIENYMLRSEQLDTKIWLAANECVARGMLLQKLPQLGGQTIVDDSDTWNHAQLLGDTLKRDEMLEHNIDTLMTRLFWEQNIRVFDPITTNFYCSCSRDKVGNMLKMLGHDEVADALSSQEVILVNCDFCGKAYQFDAVDCAQLFMDAPMANLVSNNHPSSH